MRELARVIFPYVNEHEDELELQKGDIITVLCKELEDKGWWKGELNGNIGVFPDNFVELLTSEEMVSVLSRSNLDPDHPWNYLKMVMVLGAMVTCVEVLWWSIILFVYLYHYDRL